MNARPTSTGTLTSCPPFEPEREAVVPPPSPDLQPSSSGTTRPRFGRVAILKADRLFGESLARMLVASGVTTRVEVHQDFEAVRRICAGARVDLLISGVSFPSGGGVEFLHEVSRLRLAERTLVLTGHKEPVVLGALIELRVHAIVDSWQASEVTLLTAIDALVPDLTYLCPQVRSFLEAHRRGGERLDTILSPVEQLVFALAADGTELDVIARRLTLSPHTVRRHRESVYRKLGIHTQRELLGKAVNHGVLLLRDRQVVRPGFEQKLAAYRAALPVKDRRRKRDMPNFP